MMPHIITTDPSLENLKIPVCNIFVYFHVSGLKKIVFDLLIYLFIHSFFYIYLSILTATTNKLFHERTNLKEPLWAFTNFDDYLSHC